MRLVGLEFHRGDDFGEEVVHVQWPDIQRDPAEPRAAYPFSRKGDNTDRRCSTSWWCALSKNGKAPETFAAKGLGWLVSIWRLEKGGKAAS
jgi:hypothetical protein